MSKQTEQITEDNLKIFNGLGDLKGSVIMQSNALFKAQYRIEAAEKLLVKTRNLIDKVIANRNEPVLKKDMENLQMDIDLLIHE